MKERGRGVGEVVEEVEKKGQKQVAPPKNLEGPLPKFGS